MSSIQSTTLPNGLRVVTDTVTSVDSVALGIWSSVGTRHEQMQYNGVAHMVEHMVFKGTPSRNASQIAEQVENVGGHMNAYTSREVTGYYIHLLKDEAELALDILSDMLQRPLFDQEEMDRERHVILQEIGMYVDAPDDHIYDIYQRRAYPNQTLGAPILGSTDHIKNMPREALFSYIQSNYTPSSLVISAAGNIEHDAFVTMVYKYLSDLPSDQDRPYEKADYKGGEVREVRDLEQAHLMLGFEGVGRLDPDFYSAIALSTMLGGGMSSRLFQEIREKRGLVYSIYSHQSAYQDGGQFSIYAGTGAKDLKELVPVMCEEIIKSTSDLSEQELKRAQVQMKADLLMGRESMMRRADQAAKHMIFYGKELDISDKLAAIESLDLANIHKLAKKIFSGKPTLAALGPMDHLESYDRICERLAA